MAFHDLRRRGALFGRLQRRLAADDACGVMLTEQYRMHAAICAWASEELYPHQSPLLRPTRMPFPLW